jgi:ketosteroid isomerase-like protein
MIRPLLSKLSCCLAMLAVTICARAAAPAAIEQEIMQLEKQSNDAYATNNLPKYFGYYADDAVLIFYNERTSVAAYRKMWTESVKKEPIESVKLSDVVIRVMPAADTAVASYQIEVRTRHPDGKITDEHAFETDVWVNHNSTWKLGHVHYSVTPQK